MPSKSNVHKPKAMILSPALDAVSGVSTHANMLLASSLAADFELLHFQVGSEGRQESQLQRLFRFVASPWVFGFALLRHRPRIVHLNTSLVAKAYWRDWSYLLVAKLLGAKVVNQIHGGALPREFFPGNRFLTWLLRRFVLLSDAVPVLSRAECRAYADFSPRAHVVHIPNAIDAASLLREIKSPDRMRPLKLVYVGRLAREKGLFEALAAIAALRAQGRRLTFAIAGGGADERALRETVERLGLSTVVQFLGPLFGAQKAALWQDGDAFIFPTYAEGLPYALLEAMAAGTPPITCAVGAIPDVMRHEAHGLFVPVRDAHALAAAIARLDDDRELLHRMALAARSQVLEHYTTTRLAADFRRLYLSCKRTA
jgi:glycosyltransferase involved in cell wall biosynthesis